MTVLTAGKHAQPLPWTVSGPGSLHTADGAVWHIRARSSARRRHRHRHLSVFSHHHQTHCVPSPQIPSWPQRARARHLARTPAHLLLCNDVVLRHVPYIQSLPSAVTLLTPLHLSTTEREILRGTNLYGATLDRERDWRAEWAQYRSLVHGVNPAWADAFTWDMYVTSSTHLSSRAFPSSVLSSEPSLVSTPSTYPVLIPGVDMLNHKRGHPVSWIISCQDPARDTNTVSIVAHPTSCADADASLIQVFNNYGPKPNDELILGYGFSLPDNPDDTITLLIGGSATSQKWVVGRHAQHVDGLWFDVRRMIANGESDYEDDLETAAVLSDMVQTKLDGIKTVADVRQTEEKRQAAIAIAREQGIDLVFDEDDD